MSAPRPAAGGGRWIEVPPERLTRWLAGFGERHDGIARVRAGPETVRFAGGDGAVAECHVPFPPLAPDGPDPAGALAEHAGRERRVGVVLARLGGYAAGVFVGERLVASKVGSRQVHGRSAAGGWSQQRFARRRDKQAAEALRAAADVAVRVLGPYLSGDDRLDAVVLGGDLRAVDGLRGDARLAPVFALAADGPFLTVPDPKRTVLADTPRRFRAVRVRLIDP
ncbi:MAG: hypothetical protein JWO67_4652 [Streptosporangiaceae bacterium]|nr:hypothetical protein [Streptosporangiaceae bacterium]